MGMKPDVTIQIFNLGMDHQIRVEGRIVTLHGKDCGVAVNITPTEIGKMILREIEKEKP